MNTCTKIFIFSLFIFYPTASVIADPSHYKELLVGDRAASMGGAFTAVADDASGTYHNPAGLVYGSKDSMSGISNSSHFVSNKYDNAVEGEALEQEGWRYLINFASYTKRIGKIIYGLSYLLDDSTVIQQDQEFENDFIYTKRGDDRTYKYGPSIAFQLGDRLSFGSTFYYFQRIYEQQTNQIKNTNDSESTHSFENNFGLELGLNLNVGLMWSPADSIALGLQVSKTSFTHTLDTLQTAIKSAGSDTIVYNKVVDGTPRETPLETKLGIAWFPSSYLLISGNFDYFSIEDENKENVLNLSLGVEYFLNEKHVVRAGIFTNNDNDKAPSASTTSVEKTDMQGVTLGYSIFNGPTMISLGSVWSVGRGKAQVNPDDPSAIQDSFREIYSYILSVSYNVD